nr:G252 [uncultured bacterium]
MNGEIRDPQLPDDDIPTLTEIVVPGRLRADASAGQGAGQATPEFVFDIDFTPRPTPGEQVYEFGVPQPLEQPLPDVPAVAAAPLQEDDLPLPWADASAPEQVETENTAPLPPVDATEPPSPRPVAAVEPPDADAQALLHALLAEIGSGLERRLHDELALTEQRLRSAVREELDRKLSELLAGTPPTV